MHCTFAIVFPACNIHFSVKMKVALVCLALGLFVGAVQAVPHWSRVPNNVWRHEHDILLPSWARERLNMIKRDEHGEG